MNNNDSLFSGFVDLVGIRDKASRDSDSYWKALNDFQAHVADYCHELAKSNGKIYFFSDCIFFQSSSFDQLVTFFQSLRHRLLEDGLFFKASIKKGSLDAVPAAQAISIKDKKLQKERDQILYGHFFGQIAADLFVLQEELKGIGVNVHNNISEEISGDFCFRNCYLKTGTIRTVYEYNDIKLKPDDLREGILDGILRSFFKAKSKAKKIGRFYLPLLINWVQSIDYSSIQYPKIDGGDLISVLLNTGFFRNFSDVIGIELIYFSLLNKVYIERKRKNITRRLFYDVQRFVLSQKSIVRWIDYVPEAIMTNDVRNEILEDLSNGLLKGSAEERESAVKIKELVKNGLSDNKIAETLEREGYPSPSKTRWHANTVRRICVRRNIQKTDKIKND